MNENKTTRPLILASHDQPMPLYFQLIELRRNPQGTIDKRIRATLRPLSKKDSCASELEERIKEAKLENQKYRKLILEKDSEIQVL